MYLVSVKSLHFRYGGVARQAHLHIPRNGMKVAILGLGTVVTRTGSCLIADEHDVWSVDPHELKGAAHTNEKLGICEGFAW